MQLTYERKYDFQLLFHYSDKHNTDYRNLFFFFGGVVSLQGSVFCNSDWKNWWHMVLITRAVCFILNNTARDSWSTFC